MATRCAVLPNPISEPGSEGDVGSLGSFSVFYNAIWTTTIYGALIQMSPLLDVSGYLDLSLIYGGGAGIDKTLGGHHF